MAHPAISAALNCRLMPASILYYITDRTAFSGDERTRGRRLLEKISEAARAGVDYIQLREKDLPTSELESLAREVVGTLRELRTERKQRPALLINSRADVALAVKAAGVHLRGDDISPQEVRKIWRSGAGKRGAGGLSRENPAPDPIIAVSCHSSEEVTRAATNAATFAVFAPLFEKKGALRSPPAGLTKLAEACRAKIPVLALGGVTLQNALECLDAGAAGIAGIRLFQENDIAAVVKQLRG